jgi:hypothetical protein
VSTLNYKKLSIAHRKNPIKAGNPLCLYYTKTPYALPIDSNYPLDIIIIRWWETKARLSLNPPLPI